MVVTSEKSEFRAASRRVGVFPGSFNPSHNGHLEFADKAIEAADLDCCFLYLNSISVRKQSELAPLPHRLRLLEMTVGSHPKIHIVPPDLYADCFPGSDDRQETVFLQLLDMLRVRLPGEVAFYLLRGSDNFRSAMAGGYEYPRGLREIPHVIGVRQEDHRNFNFSAISHATFVSVVECSSSRVRELLASPSCDTIPLPSAAIEYIDEHNLYRQQS